jgi:C-terminal processing protease CtpA/Prc
MPRLSVRQPHIKGRVAFMTGPAAISSAETFMALVAYYRLGEIVGAATAGTNGDIAQIAMPSGCTAWFTGRRVTRPGGGQHHLIGVQPTIPVSRSIAGVRAGLDEILDSALAYVRTGAK